MGGRDDQRVGSASLAIVANHAAGRGRAVDVARRLRRAASERGHTVVELDADDAASTRAAIASLPDAIGRVIAVGGDGLVHHVIQHLAGTDREFGLVPVGTGNDFAAAVDIPDDEAAAIDLALGPTRPLDLISSDHGWVATIATGGFSASVTARAERIRIPLGARVYTAATVLELPGLRPWRVGMALDGGEPVEIETVLLAVANTPRFGGGMQICPDADPNDGLLDITAIGPVGRLHLLRVFPKVFDGAHLGEPEVLTWRARSVTLTGDLDLWADGERLGPAPLTLTAERGALRLAVPDVTERDHRRAE